jgi:hypothetical protein
LGGLPLLSGACTGRSEPPILVGRWPLCGARNAIEVHDRAFGFRNVDVFAD